MDKNQNRVTLTDLMSNWWSQHPVGPLAPLGWDALADCECHASREYWSKITSLAYMQCIDLATSAICRSGR
jgi:hypothetical protein